MKRGLEWVCEDQEEGKQKKTAIIILTAKEQGSEDRLDLYERYGSRSGRS